ncbi:hypothetical protein N9470_02975 [Emcibacteraceae bacterium]|jgi:hypothetical protein|nr:hypothetical protein [Emcibacteraceae bacterium]
MPGTEEEKVQNDINQAALTDPNFAAAIMNLTDEEKLNMYRDYIGETAILGSELETANDTLSTAMPSVIQAGNTVVADPTALAQGLKNFQAGRERKRINNDLRGLSAGKTAGTLTTANTLGSVAQQQMTADALRRKKEEEENKLGYGSSGPNRNPVYT